MKTLNGTFNKLTKADHNLCLIFRKENRFAPKIEQLALPQLQSEGPYIDEFVEDSNGWLYVRWSGPGDFQRLRTQYYWICVGITLKS